MSPDLAQLLLVVASGNDPRLDMALLRLGLQLISPRIEHELNSNPFPLLDGEDVVAILHPGEALRPVPRHASADPGPSDDDLAAQLQSRRLRRYLEGA